MRSPLLLLLAALALPGMPVAAQDLESQTILEWDGTPEPHWSLRSPWVVARQADLVRSGRGSLRATFSPPDKWPGINVQKEALANEDAKAILFDVYHGGDEKQSVRVRLDDVHSKDNDDELYRRTFPLKKGWNTIRIGFDEARTQSGSRTLDPQALTYMKIYVTYPKKDVVLIFDHLRFEVPPRVRDAKEARRLVQAFTRSYRPEKLEFEEARNLLRGLERADIPDRVKALHRVLDRGEDARLLAETVRVLGTTRDEASVELLLRLTEKASGPTLWRLYDALGQMGVPAARACLLAALNEQEGSPEKTAALLAFTQSNDAEALPHLEAALGGSWQLQVARVEALTRQPITTGFLPLTAFLEHENVRVRDDARQALVAFAGRDLGFKASAWTDWYRANEGRIARGEPLPGGDRLGRSPYGSYYGIPVLPGRMAFVIDLSGSMEAELPEAAKAYVAQAKHLNPEEVKTRLDLARAEAAHVIKGLPETAEFQVVFFNDRARLWKRGGPHRATASNKADAIRTIESYADPGYTNLYDGLVRAMDPDPKASFERSYADSVDTIYLLSDGDPSRGEIIEYRHLVADIHDRNRVRRIRFHTIGIGVKDHLLLRDLAAATGGQYVDLAR